MRLDRGGLDRYGLDRSFGAFFISLACQINGGGDMIADLSVPAYLASVIDGTGDIVANLLVPASLACQIDGTGDIIAFLARTEAVEITYTGTIAAGKILCIDANDFSVLNDGANDIANYDGEFPEIYNTTIVVYEDSDGSRSLSVVITREDRTP